MTLLKENEESSQDKISSDIVPGSFIEVKITGEGKSRTVHKYVAVCQTSVYKEDLRVVFLKKMEKAQKPLFQMKKMKGKSALIKF